MLYAVNYGNNKWKRAQKMNTKHAIKYGKVDKVISFSDKDIDSDFREKNKKILTQKRGNGYWLWKPYFVKKALDLIKVGDYLLYTDSGSCCINDIHILIDYMEKDKNDIMLFSLNYKEKKYAKRDAFILMGCDSKKYYDTIGCMAGFILLKKTERTEKIITEWLHYSQDYRIITDAPNECGKPNYDSFVENRHDQTVLSLVCKKNNCKFYRDASQYGNEIIKEGEYPQIFYLHRIPIAKNMLEVKLFGKILPKLMPIYKKIIK